MIDRLPTRKYVEANMAAELRLPFDRQDFLYLEVAAAYLRLMDEKRHLTDALRKAKLDMLVSRSIPEMRELMVKLYACLPAPPLREGWIEEWFDDLSTTLRVLAETGESDG